jgi:hypothetical protein
MRSGLITLAVAVAVTACSAKDKSSAAGTAGDSSAATPAAAVAAAPAPDDPTAEISSYNLDMDKMTKWMGVMKTVGSESKKDTSLRSQFNLGDDKTVDISVNRLESNPVATAAFKANNISARDFVMTTLAYMQAGMVAGMLKSVPNYKAPAGMNMKNVDFMNQHGAEFDKALKAMSPDQDN